MGIPTSEVGYTPAMPREGGPRSTQGHVVGALDKIIWGQTTFQNFHKNKSYRLIVGAVGLPRLPRNKASGKRTRHHKVKFSFWNLRLTSATCSGKKCPCITITLSFFRNKETTSVHCSGIGLLLSAVLQNGFTQMSRKPHSVSLTTSLAGRVLNILLISLLTYLPHGAESFLSSWLACS